MAIASEHEWGRILQGWADAQRGEATTGIARIRDGLAASEATARINTPLHLALLAEALALTEKIDEALAALDDALAEAAVSGATGWSAEIHRLRGELTGRLPYPESARSTANPSGHPLPHYPNGAHPMPQTGSCRSL